MRWLSSPGRSTLMPPFLRAFVLASAALAMWLASNGISFAADNAVMAAWRKGGVAVLLRHSATPPGVGDPAEFRLGDCSTQRNLNDEGRAQARRIGEWFRTSGVLPTAVRHSPWCRTRETAELAFGRSSEWTALSSPYQDRAGFERSVDEVRAYIAALKPGERPVLVTHGANITAMAGSSLLRQGEGVLVRARRDAAGRIELQEIGRIDVP
jgi:phosphohistidine phosphatase SixA